ncbi:PSP1 domain-containing protein [Geoalkalibacter halelectricus]|uniref:Stage 0 sporulation family protein n=1 Tax=Geoalkalibacter halelectricus TaxID=2847045 RepID=A0ABY5ZRC3_9BACT|nr:stage 0 sporulation family protein [Geoalkalibacter halelectricus]MDO3380058.1 stage 0 sporulation family protein [Geoalkalibacter halelectricus]UWZ80420.1 stage 0 sporulation family protein [Geoalkalibacter halelectricus]
MIRVVSIKFRDAGRVYDFDAGDLDLKTGAKVVVETERGRALGVVVTAPREVEEAGQGEELKKILRPVSAEDLDLAARFAAREEEAHRFCRKRIEERGLEMKLVQAEYLFDGSKIIFYFTADGRIDFRDLVKDLAHYFHTRIEMRQIGVRDEAKLVGGIGICGRELCCCTFLRDFHPVSVKMAKEQGLALNPNKISGQCGRLLCCLGYEYETYCHLKRGLPKAGRIIKVGELEAMVLSQNIFAGTVKVKLETGTEAILSAQDIERGEVPPKKSPLPAEPAEKPAPPAPAAQPRGEGEKPARKRSRGRSRGKKKGAGAEGGEPKQAGAEQQKPSMPAGQRPQPPAAPADASGKPAGGERKRRPRRRSRKKDQPG